MKRIMIAAICFISLQAVKAQIEGITAFEQPSTSKITPKLKVSINTKQANSIDVSQDNKAFANFTTQQLVDGWERTKTSVYSSSTKDAFGTIAVSIIYLKVKRLPDNSGMWVVRQAGLLNPLTKKTDYSTRDSTLFPNPFFKKTTKPIPGTKLEWHQEFTISNIEFETLFVDDEKVDPYRKTSEYAGLLEFKIFTKNGTQKKLIKNGGIIFNKTANQNAISYVPMEIGKKYPALGNPTFNFSISQTDFEKGYISIAGSLSDMDPTKAIESSTIGLMTTLQELNNSTNKDLKDCVYQKNYIDIKKGDYTFRVHFIIKPVG